MRYILNSPVLTEFGVYTYRPVLLGDAKEFAKSAVSAIGHEGTAQVLTQMLGIPIKANRIQIKMEIEDEALVIQVLQRLPEGKVLTEEELKNVPMRLGILKRVA